MNAARLMLALVVAVMIAAAATVAVMSPNSGPDFAVYWAAQRAGNAYDNLAVQSVLMGEIGRDVGAGFSYPPTFLLLTKPLALLPYHPAYAIWVTLSLMAAILATPHRFSPLIVVAPVMLFATLTGQATLFVGALLFTALRLAERPRLAGLCLGLALCIKPQLAMLAPLGLLIGGRWQPVLWATVTGASVSVLATIAFGPPVWLNWFSGLGAFSSAQAKYPDFQDEIPQLARYALAAVGLALLVHAFRRGGHAEQLISAVVTAMLVSPYARAYDVAAVAPAAFSLLRRDLRAIAPALLLGSPVGAWSILIALCAALPLTAGATARPRPLRIGPDWEPK